MNKSTDNGRADAFEAYINDQDIESSITVHEDGRIEINGVLGADAAMNLLHSAIRLIDDYMRTRALPGMIFTSDIPKGDNDFPASDNDMHIPF